ncbi:putative two component system histidine kinase [Streptomyces scabiei 87.22]|uniref:histidine kinase n=1 Tax=Streptomyces scabiei (strain 87.22) TaxID=680198 RepID=C9YYS3_STRSW|nr:ATP-binding protein [Streptomyces scabiei]MDX2580093.1 ATP-binding protein [Streptomyces scabiei]MDX2654969.1 ATP-binding protein [Streptomyces scabiei]MDX2720667.1 ATP-binding protein [Streptomyces scabiei]MDX2870656.1 ATP-binding protein [Streptomyces scabiei]MDX2885894.1 ATP-binding protein [Streptomyces scabiei]
MLVLQLAIVVVVLLAVAAVSLTQSAATFNRVEGRRVTALAEQLAANPLVRDRLAQPVAHEVLAPLVNSVQTQSGVTSVTVADADGRIVSSTDPTVIGETMPADGTAVAGRGWSGPLTFDGNRELVAQVPVLGATVDDDLGRLLGTVMIGEAAPTVWQRLGGASSYLLAYLGIASGLGLAGSWLLARRVKRQTLGLEPQEIAGLAEHREAMLYGIAEGVIALDPQHRLTLANEMGRRLLDLPGDCVGKSLADLGVEGRLRDVLVGAQEAGGGARDDGTGTGEGTAGRDAAEVARAGETGARPTAVGARPAAVGVRAGAAGSDEGGAEEPDESTGRPGDPATAQDAPADRRDEVVVRRGRVLVMNRMTVTKDGRHLGSVTTLRDRTELARLEREIGSFRSSAELLRAQAHEFANQLHTISGLIQIGEQDEVVHYIRALSRHRHSLDVTLSRRVRDTAVAALLTAKTSLAAERRVTLRISESTALDRLAPEDAADVATVVGNLVDNAVDAAATTTLPDGHEAWVEVELRQDASSVEIVVRDSGPGVAPELAREVFAHGFTTKAAREGERGIGLALTRLVCERHGGEISVTNTPDGAMFTARMTVSHLADAVAEGASP